MIREIIQEAKVLGMNLIDPDRVELTDGFCELIARKLDALMLQAEADHDLPMMRQIVITYAEGLEAKRNFDTARLRQIFARVEGWGE
jgi:hypothetical protein